MTRTTKRFGLPALLLTALAAVVLVPVLLGGTEPNTEPKTDPNNADPEPQELATPDTVLATVMIRAGLDFEQLAAAGVGAVETAQVLAQGVAFLEASEASLDSLDQTYANARVTRDQLHRKVRSGLASSEEVAALQSAKTAFTAADHARASFLDSLFESAVGDCDALVITRLRNLRENSEWSLPEHFCTVERTQQQWVDLRDALANEKISAKYAEEPDPGSQSLLAACNAETEVAASKVSLDTNGSAVEAAWCTALEAN